MSRNTLDRSRESFAYDIHKEPVTRGEAFDYDAINISIENILCTYYGERVNNPYFGCELPATIFESLQEEGKAERLLDNIIEAIEMWENRVAIVKDKVAMKILSDENAMELNIPYIVKNTNIKSSFEKRIIF